MNAKQYLMQLEILEKGCITQKEYIEDLRSSLLNISCSTDSVGVSSSSDPDKYGTVMGRIEQAEKELGRRETEALNFRLTLLDKIYQLTDKRYRDVLVFRYVYWEKYPTLGDVAKGMMYSESHIQRIHNEAIAFFEMIV